MTEKKNIGKEILHNSFQSLEIAAVLFIVIGMVIDITNHGNMDFTDYDFTRMALACLLIGPGFGVPSAIYKNDRLPLGIQVFIHMGIGCTVLLLCSYLAGWIPASKGPGPVIAAITAEIAAAFVIWAVFYHTGQKMAAKMNERIDEIKNSR